MWARVLEFTMAIWLSISPFILGYADELRFFWVNDLIVAPLMVFFSLISLYAPLRKMHLCNLLTSAYLVFLSYFFKGLEANALLQNYMVLGLLLFMLTIVPTDAAKPPIPWRDFYR